MFDNPSRRKIGIAQIQQRTFAISQGLALRHDKVDGLVLSRRSRGRNIAEAAAGDHHIGEIRAFHRQVIDVATLDLELAGVHSESSLNFDIFDGELAALEVDVNIELVGRRIRAAGGEIALQGDAALGQFNGIALINIIDQTNGGLLLLHGEVKGFRYCRASVVSIGRSPIVRILHRKGSILEHGFYGDLLTRHGKAVVRAYRELTGIEAGKQLTEGLLVAQLHLRPGLYQDARNIAAGEGIGLIQAGNGTFILVVFQGIVFLGVLLGEGSGGRRHDGAQGAGKERRGLGSLQADGAGIGSAAQGQGAALRHQQGLTLPHGHRGASGRSLNGALAALEEDEAAGYAAVAQIGPRIDADGGSLGGSQAPVEGISALPHGHLHIAPVDHHRAGGKAFFAIFSVDIAAVDHNVIHTNGSTVAGIRDGPQDTGAALLAVDGERRIRAVAIPNAGFGDELRAVRQNQLHIAYNIKSIFQVKGACHQVPATGGTIHFLSEDRALGDGLLRAVFIIIDCPHRAAARANAGLEGMGMGLDGDGGTEHGEGALRLIEAALLLVTVIIDPVGDLPAIGLDALIGGQGDGLAHFAVNLPLMLHQNSLAGSGAILQIQGAVDSNAFSHGGGSRKGGIHAVQIDRAGAHPCAIVLDACVLGHGQRGILGNGQRFLIKNIKSTPEGGIAIDCGIAAHADDAVGDGSILGQFGSNNLGIADGNAAGSAIHRHADAAVSGSLRLYRTAVNGDGAADFLGIAADGSIRL